MILPWTRVHHFRADDPVSDPVADQEIINSPAAVVDFACFYPLCPPGVNAGHAAVNMTETVCHAGRKKIAEALDCDYEAHFVLRETGERL